MGNLISLVVGEKYPDPYYHNDSATLTVYGASFNILVSIGNIKPSDAKAFRGGKLRMGVTVAQSIPFVLLDIPGLATFDASLNIHAVSLEKRDVFLAGDPEFNAVDLYLVDNQTDILAGIRVLSCDVEIMRTIKEAAFEQLTTYHSAAEADMAVQRVMAEYTTADLIRDAKMQVFK